MTEHVKQITAILYDLKFNKLYISDALQAVLKFGLDEYAQGYLDGINDGDQE